MVNNRTIPVKQVNYSLQPTTEHRLSDFVSVECLCFKVRSLTLQSSSGMCNFVTLIPDIRQDIRRGISYLVWVNKKRYIFAKRLVVILGESYFT